MVDPLSLFRRLLCFSPEQNMPGETKIEAQNSERKKSEPLRTNLTEYSPTPDVFRLCFEEYEQSLLGDSSYLNEC